MTCAFYIFASVVADIACIKILFVSFGMRERMKEVFCIYHILAIPVMFALPEVEFTTCYNIIFISECPLFL